MFSLPNRLRSITPVLQKTLITSSQTQCFRKSLLERGIIYATKNFHLNHPKKHHFLNLRGGPSSVSDSLQGRLEVVPYLNMLNEGLVEIHRTLTSEDKDKLGDALEWCSKVFDYNVKNGKKIRGIALLKAYCSYAFSMDDDILWRRWYSGDWKSAVILAWCVEMLQAYFIILDDIMDQSCMRRGEPCWYKKPDVGLCAINDALLLYSGIFKLLQKHFGGLKCYHSMLHEFLQVNEKTVYGQCLDMLFNPINQKPRFENFTFERYQTLVEHKTSNYTYCLPVHLGMHLAGGCTSEDFKLTRQICLKLGLYFQSQDDYLDCYGNSKTTGKFGNDIREGKCTWFSVKYLEEASEPQKKKFMENYGVNDEDSIASIMELYQQSSLLKKYKSFEEQNSSEIVSLINSMNDSKSGLFSSLISELRRREK